MVYKCDRCSRLSREPRQFRSVMHTESLDDSYYCIENKKIPLDDLTLEEYKAISLFEEDIYEAISMKTCVEMTYDRCTGKTAHIGKSDRNRQKLIL